MTTSELLWREQLEAGCSLDTYTLIELLGYGGQGVVWSAWDNRHKRVAALKIIAAEASDPDDEIIAFEREAHLVASLDHPNILPLYEFGAISNLHFLAMRYMSAGSLVALLERGPLPPRAVLRLAAQITTALDYVHGRDIVHRDLKPSNVMLDTRRRVYLSDFGLAKRLSQTTAILHTGQGTAPYAPPEQHTMAELSHTSDIYSLGVLLFQMFAGSLPWHGEYALAIRQLDAGESIPDPRDSNPALPARLASALRILTAASPEARPQSVVDAFNLVASAFEQPSADNRDLGVSYLEFVLRETLPSSDGKTPVGQDASQLVQNSLKRWDPDVAPFALSRTAFIFAESAFSQPAQHGLTVDETISQFFLRGALAHGHRQDFWWRQVTDPAARLRLCEGAIVNERDEVAGRVLEKVLAEPPDALPLRMLSQPTLERLIDLGLRASGFALQDNAFELLERWADTAEGWRTVGITPDADARLADLALGDSSRSKRAAQLIARMRSQNAVHQLLAAQERSASAKALNALAEVRKIGGRLPRRTPFSIRLRVSARILRQRLLEGRMVLFWTRPLFGLLAGAFASLMMVFGVFSQQRLQLRDVLFQPHPVSDVVTIVEVDDASLARYGRWDEWPRALHADLIDRLSEGGARVIVLDFVFASETADDPLLAEAMQRAGTVVQPVLGQGDAYHDIPDTVRFDGGIWPQPDLLATSAAIGHTNVLHDVDGYVREIPAVATIEGERYPSIALAALQVYLETGERALPLVDRGQMVVAGRRIPVGPSSEMQVNFVGPPSQEGISTFHSVSYQTVLDGDAPSGYIEDKIVLVGMTATAEPDRYLTPISSGRPMYGVEILANAIETVWSGRFLRLPSVWVQIGILLLLGLLTGLLSARPWMGLIIASGEAILYFIAASFLFDRNGIMLDLLYPFLAIVLSYVTVTTYRLSSEVRQRRAIVRLFEARVTPDVAQATLQAVQRGEINLSGQVQEITVMFAGIRNYTAFAEAHTPEDVMEMVNTFLSIAADVVFGFEGMLAHFEGDQAMALFNAPMAQPDHAKLAVRTALTIRQRILAYHQSLRAGHPHQSIDFGYGVYTGKAVVGHAGSRDRYEYTALGDTIDIASRLTSEARAGQILIGDATYEHVRDAVVTQPLHAISIKGRLESIQVVAVLGTND